MTTLSTERVRFEAALLELMETYLTGSGSGGSIYGGNISLSRLEIVDFVKAKLDELSVDGISGMIFSLSSAPNISDPLSLLINAQLDECTKDILLSAPITVLVPTAQTGATSVPFVDNKSGYIVLADNFLRLSSFKMAEWKRDGELITPQSKKYKLQSTTRRGGTVKPIGVLTWKNVDGSLKRIIEYYSVINSHAIEKLLYLPETLAEDFIALQPNLLDSLGWQCAGKIMQITGMMDASKLAQERVTQSYNNL